MIIIVEDGSRTEPNANSYVTEAELTTYATDRGITLTEDTSVLLTKAMDWIEAQNFIGTKYTEDQPLQWPRWNYTIDGYYKESDYIPKELKNGLMALALNIDAGIDPLAATQRHTKREKLDVLEVEYSDSSVSKPISRTHLVALRKLLVGGSSGALRRTR